MSPPRSPNAAAETADSKQAAATPTRSGDKEMWESLEARFSAGVGDPNASWIDVWALLVESRAVEKMTAIVAATSIPAGRRDKTYWQAELEQHIRFRMGQKLRMRRDLGFIASRGSLRTWMNRLITNECRSFWRRQRTWRHVDLPEEAGSLPSAAETAQETDHAATRMAVRQGIDQLDEPSRTLMNLLAIGRTQSQIAEALELTVAQVRRRKDAAVEQVRRSLKARGIGPP